VVRRFARFQWKVVWKSLPTDDGATFDTVVELDAAEIAPQVTWGTSPEQVVAVNATVPGPADFDHQGKAVTAIAVPGSYEVKKDAEAEGIDKIFMDAGWEWREPGCSMCLAMNGDQLKPEERCASTSNRNFEGRQGKGGRTHLVSPAMAAATAAAGRFVDIRTL